MEATQKTILSRLERVVKFIDGQDIEKGAEQSSIYSTNNVAPFASSPSSHYQGAPQLSAPFVHTQPASPFANLERPFSYSIDENMQPKFVPPLHQQHQFSFPRSQPQFSVPHTAQPQFGIDQPTQPKFTVTAQPQFNLDQPMHPQFTAPRTPRPEINVDQPTQPQFGTPHTTIQRQPFFQGTTNTLPKVLPISRKSTTVCLSSSEINKKGLQTTDTFFISHRNLKGESKAGMLAVRLARKVYFGKEVMGKCTVSGLRGLPGLPVAELGELKQTIFLQFPQFWQNPVEFEQLWSKCADAINQSCKKIRQEQQQRK